MASGFQALASRAIAGLSKGAIDKQLRWQARGSHYLRGRRLKNTGMVRVDPAISEMVLQEMNLMTPAVAIAYEEELVPVAQAALDEWPVQTGLSRSLVALEFKQEGDIFTAELRNDAPYAAFIKSPDSVAQRLIFRAGEAAAERIVERILRQISSGRLD